MNEVIPIDAVIAWVDGNDPEHKKKVKRYLPPEALADESVASPTRFESNNEINFCVASILRFAPFIRKIFIVTDNQNPQLDDFIRKNFPDNKTPIEIVDHSVIFRGYEEYLPLLNSIGIETCVHRIPGLSEHYVYFNDDFFLLRDIKPTDWFVDGKVVASGKWRSLAADNIMSHLRIGKRRKGEFTFKGTMKNAAALLGITGRYFYISHTPHPIIKSMLTEYFDNHPEAIVRNISHRTRHKDQYIPQGLAYMLALQQNRCMIKWRHELYLRPDVKDKYYLKRKIFLFKIKRHYWGCIQSMGLSKENIRNAVYDWLQGVIKIKI